MSLEYYQQQWKEAQDDLKKNLRADAKLGKKGPIPDLEKAKWLVGHLFMNYVGIVNRLDDCYDQMVHPQKREVIGRLLDLSLGRLLELKSEIVRIEFDDYCFFDNVLIELKLTHRDMEIQIPKYFWRDREKQAAHRRQMMQLVFEEAEREAFKIEYLKNVPEEEKEEVWQKYMVKEEQLRLEKEKFEEQQRKMQMHEMQKDSLEELAKKLKQPPIIDKEAIVDAISMIQRHERARQGRIQVTLAKQLRALKRRGDTGEKISEEKANAAATVIQRHWRRHHRRVKERKAKQQLQNMLDMTRSSYKDKAKYERLENVAKLRRKIQDRNQREYEEALVRVKEKVTTLYSIPMEEDMVDEIMAWFRWYFEQSEYLPDYPPEKPIIPTGDIQGIPKKLGPSFAEKLYPAKKKPGQLQRAPPKVSALGIALTGISAIGGTALVLAEQWIGPKEFVKCQKELEKRKKAGKGADDGKKEKLTKEQKKELKKKEKELEKKLQMLEEAEGFRLKDSSYLAPLNKADRDYRVVWMDRDETKNPEQRYIYDFVKDEKCFELSMEIRKTVDVMMELELEVLKDALERDKNPKKKKKKNKPKKKKEKQKKGKKDPTGDRTIDDLFMELFRNGIIREYEPVYLKEYLGERSYGAFDMRRQLVDWPPSSGDVRELILQLCILPLGSSRIHQLSPLVKSVCLLGTENSGKEFLARIVCTETASVMFDLTPTNVAGKYPGKDGLKMLEHLVEKMSRVLQPSVIFVDGAEKTFYKKVPKEEKELDPKRLSKSISKIVKGIKPEDQVLLLGVSSQPWMAQKNKFLKAYVKTIQIPQMDYGSYVKLWQDLLVPYHSVPGDFDVSCLARVSNGFSVKAIIDTVQKVLTTERISRSRFQPYTQVEFLEELLRNPAIDPKLTDKSLKFYSGLDLPKKRAKRLLDIKAEIEKASKKK